MSPAPKARLIFGRGKDQTLDPAKPLPANPLIEADRLLFTKINSEWTNPVLDAVMPAITDLHKNPYFHLSLLLFLAVWVYRQRSWAVKWILVAIISVGASDLVSYRLVKAQVLRDRPQFAGLEVQLRTHQHTGTSFPSNHAANIFALATSLSGGMPYLAPVLFTIAALVAYSRVYVGVHFPLDVAGGALIGMAIAIFVRILASGWLQMPRAPEPKSDARSFRGRN